MIALPQKADETTRALAHELRISLTAASVLRKRGHTTAETIGRFFDPKLADLTPPHAMRDRVGAVERICHAIRRGERISVFGDYDADGVTAAALMTGLLRQFGARVSTVLADRFAGGYGLSDPALDRVLEGSPSLLITCDCGSSDHERLDRARRAGVDVIVIDHHRVPPEPLPALAFLNPHRPECDFAYKGLASVGLALSICAGIRTALGVNVDLREWLDLVAIGTIGDVAPLNGDNRALVRTGLWMLARGQRQGTRALSDVAGYSADIPLTGEDVAFRFAPRINAPGRLGKPDIALQLLLCNDPKEARALAVELDRLCEERKTIDRAILAEAITMLEDPAFAALPAIVLAKQGWHPGVVGIVAGRLASRFGKPTIVIGLEGQTGRGSVRGPAGVPLYDALNRCKEAMLGFGGHQAAAGVHVEAHEVNRLRDLFCAACVELGGSAESGPQAIDAILERGDSPDLVLRELSRFEPCGFANPAPRLALEDARVVAAREVRGGHLKVDIDLDGISLSAFGYEMAAQTPARGSRVHLVGRLRFDSYGIRQGLNRGIAEIRIEEIVAA